MSDLLHYQAYCSKARREREREREETGEGEAGARAFGDVSGPTFSDRACVHGHGGGSFLGMHQSVRLLDGCIRRFSHIHARCTHGVLGLLACCLFIRLSLFFCVCLYPCLADGRTVGIARYRLLVLVYYPTALFHLLLLLLNIK